MIFHNSLVSCYIFSPGLGIYKRKKENTQERQQDSYKKTHTKTRKQDLVQENTQKRTRTRKCPRKQELVQENTHSYKKVSTQKRTHARKHALVHEKS